MGHSALFRGLGCNKQGNRYSSHGQRERHGDNRREMAGPSLRSLAGRHEYLRFVEVTHIPADGSRQGCMTGGAVVPGSVQDQFPSAGAVSPEGAAGAVTAGGALRSISRDSVSRNRM